MRADGRRRLHRTVRSHIHKKSRRVRAKLITCHSQSAMDATSEGYTEDVTVIAISITPVSTPVHDLDTYGDRQSLGKGIPKYGTEGISGCVICYRGKCRGAWIHRAIYHRRRRVETNLFRPYLQHRHLRGVVGPDEGVSIVRARDDLVGYGRPRNPRDDQVMLL